MRFGMLVFASAILLSSSAQAGMFEDLKEAVSDFFEDSHQNVEKNEEALKDGKSDFPISNEQQKIQEIVATLSKLPKPSEKELQQMKERSEFLKEAVESIPKTSMDWDESVSRYEDVKVLEGAPSEEQIERAEVEKQKDIEMGYTSSSEELDSDDKVAGVTPKNIIPVVPAYCGEGPHQPIDIVQGQPLPAPFAICDKPTYLQMVSHPNGYFYLKNDIDLGEVHDHYHIKKFTGILDGRGKLLSFSFMGWYPWIEELRGAIANLNLKYSLNLKHLTIPVMDDCSGTGNAFYEMFHFGLIGRGCRSVLSNVNVINGDVQLSQSVKEWNPRSVSGIYGIAIATQDSDIQAKVNVSNAVGTVVNQPDVGGVYGYVFRENSVAPLLNIFVKSGSKIGGTKSSVGAYTASGFAFLIHGNSGLTVSNISIEQGTEITGAVVNGFAQAVNTYASEMTPSILENIGIFGSLKFLPLQNTPLTATGFAYELSGHNKFKNIAMNAKLPQTNEKYLIGGISHNSMNFEDLQISGSLTSSTNLFNYFKFYKGQGAWDANVSFNRLSVYARSSSFGYIHGSIQVGGGSYIPLPHPSLRVLSSFFFRFLPQINIGPVWVNDNSTGYPQTPEVFSLEQSKSLNCEFFRKKASFVGYDFTTTWKMGPKFPLLKDITYPSEFYEVAEPCPAIEQ